MRDELGNGRRERRERRNAAVRRDRVRSFDSRVGGSPGRRPTICEGNAVGSSLSGRSSKRFSSRVEEGPVGVVQEADEVPVRPSHHLREARLGPHAGHAAFYAALYARRALLRRLQLGAILRPGAARRLHLLRRRRSSPPLVAVPVMLALALLTPRAMVVRMVLTVMLVAMTVSVTALTTPIAMTRRTRG